MKPKATRQTFGETLAELGAKNPKIVVLDADLSKSTKSEMFAKKFPERFFEMGIAEANMIGTGAGLALSGYVPFICSFGAFVTGRYDQIRMSIAYSKANVRVIGTHAGIGIGDDGHSQMGLEDLSLMRGLPDMAVFQPCDEIETKQVIEFLADYQGPAYVRLTRQNLESMHGADYKFALGKLDVLKKSSSTSNSIALLATGATVQEAKKALESLSSNTQAKCSLINVPTIKPFDAAGIAALAKTHSTFVTVEDHYTTGGIGSCVAEALASTGSGARLVRLGVQDIPGESGEPAELYEKYGFSAGKIAEALKSVL